MAGKFHIINNIKLINKQKVPAPFNRADMFRSRANSAHVARVLKARATYSGRDEVNGEKIQ